MPAQPLRVGLALGFRIQGSGIRVQDSGFKVQDLGFRVQVWGFKVVSARIGVWGSGLRV